MTPVGRKDFLIGGFILGWGREKIQSPLRLFVCLFVWLKGGRFIDGDVPPPEN